MKRARVHAGTHIRRRTAAVVVALSAAASAGAWVLGAQERVARASPPPASGPDADADGLPDRLEAFLGTSMDKPDTDGDNFSDAEELARDSNPLSPVSIPPLQDVTVDVSAYVDGGSLHPFTCIYIAGGDVSDKTLTMGVRIGSQLVTRPISYFLGGSAPQVLQGASPQDIVIVLDGVLSDQFLHRFGSLSFFTTIAQESQVIAAAAVNLFSADGEVLQLMQVPTASSPAPSGQPSGGAQGGIYRPLNPGSSSPSWIVGAICAQTLATVGTIGPVLIQEVVDADCQSGWDSLCAPSCAATTGSTIRVLDPAALVGG